MRVTRRSTISLLAILLSFAVLAGRAEAQPREPIRYTFRVIDAAKHIAEVDARFPSPGQSSLDLMMPVWTPGFYRVEDYAARMQSLVARTPEGVTLDVTKPRPNRWQVSTNGSAAVVVTYRLLCQGRSVTTTRVDAGLGVINGGATFITMADRTETPPTTRFLRLYRRGRATGGTFRDGRALALTSSRRSQWLPPERGLIRVQMYMT